MMETKIYTKQDIPEAAAELRAGHLVSFPTETVYGLGAIVDNEAAVRQVYVAKGRPSDNPLIVTVCSPEMVWKYAVKSELAEKLMATFWPGPLTIILPLQPNTLSSVVTGGLSTAAFRMPKNDATLELIKETGTPIVGPSANTSGKPSPTKAQHVYHDLRGKIAGILDDGQTQVGLESTIIDLSVAPAAILRPGYYDADDLAPLLGTVDTAQHHVGAKETPKAPGMKYKHYAPAAQVLIVEPTKNFAEAVAKTRQHYRKPFGVLAFDEQLQTLVTSDLVTTYSLGADIQSASHQLFAGLRWFDDQPGIDLILAAGVPEKGLGIAYMNRLKKSAGGQFYEATVF